MGEIKRCFPTPESYQNSENLKQDLKEREA